MPPAPDSATRDVRLSATKQALLEQMLRPRAAAGPRVTARPPAEPRALSYAQERLWFVEQLGTGTAAYHVSVGVWLDGDLDPDILRAALDDVAARQESLRMSFPPDADGQPSVAVAAALSVPLELAEVTAADPAEARQQALDLARVEAAAPFDLAAGPLVRARLIRYGERAHLLSLETHHIVSDGWSIDVLVGDLLTAYRARRDGTEPTWPPLPVQYGDYAHWQRHHGGVERGLAYWVEQLVGVPALELPTDRTRPPTQRFDGATHRFEIDAELIGAVTELARRHDATLYMSLLAAYEVLLGRYAGQDDFAVGSPVAGRGHPELEGLVGMFVNMLPMRARLDDAESFAGLLARTRQAVLDGLTHQQVQFEQIVAELGVPRDVSRAPLFQVTLALQNYRMRDHAAGGDGGGPTAQWEVLDLSATRFDLELLAVQARDGRLWCEFTYNVALFDAATVEALSRHLIQLLRVVTARPDTPLREVDLLADDERARIVGEWAGGAARHPVEQTLHGLFEAQAARRPDAVAVVCGETEVSYAELDRRADRLAHRLRRLGVGPETLVALHLQPSVGTV